MLDSMIERVAAAICGEASWSASSDDQKESFRGQARDAIKAMREPTDAMLNAGNEEMGFDDVSPAWPAMIDAALADQAHPAE